MCFRNIYIHFTLFMQIFDPLKKKNPYFEQKVKGINGDIGKSGFGLTTEDRDFLTKEVLCG